MTAEANRRLLLPTSLTPTEHLEQAAASMSAPTLWVRGTGGERTRLPDKSPEPKAGLQIQIALPIASGGSPNEAPPPPPQVLFRTQEVIRPPPVSEDWNEMAGPPGTAPLDPVDAPPGLVDHPPGFEEERGADEAPDSVPVSEDAQPVVAQLPERSNRAESARVEEEASSLAEEGLRASPVPILPSDYYEGAPGTLPLDPVDAPPGLSDAPPGFEELHPVEEPATDLSGAENGPPGLDDVLPQPPIRPLGTPLNLPPVAHHQVGASMEGPSKLAPPVRPIGSVEEPPEWRPYDDVAPEAPAAPVLAAEPVLVSEEVEDASGEPPGLEMDALDELEEDMQLFSDLSEHSMSDLDPDAPGEPWSAGVGLGEDEADVTVVEAVSVVESASPGKDVGPRSVAAEAVESAWQARPLSERLAGGSLLILGAWATWKIWSVL